MRLSIANNKLFLIMVKQLSHMWLLPSIVEFNSARKVLTLYSPKPHGHCHTNNVTNIHYKIQLIIPAYNVEKYIQKCLSSIKPILHKNNKICVQIVDDGSTDTTSKQIEKFWNRIHENVVVIHQTNKGLSEARNVGLNNLLGEYIMFLDADDYLPDCFNLDSCLKHVLGCDVLQGDWLMVNTYGEELEHRSADSLSGYAWGKLYHHSIFSNLHFPEGYWYEDTIVRFIVSRIAKRIGHIDDCIYCHRKNPEGISAMARRYHKIIDTYWITELCIEELPKFGIEYDQESLDCLLHQSVVNQMRIRKLPRKIRKAVFSLTVELIEKYFENVNSEQYKELETALRNRQFCRFELLAIANALKE